MKQLRAFFARLFKRQEGCASLFSDAVTDGFIDMFKEMGYKMNDNNENKKTGDGKIWNS